MIAAGHPDLTFELDSYSAIMPPHWKPSPDPNYGIRDWSVGQAVALRETLNRVARHARSGQWPEYSDLDCFTCHHSLTKAADSWRQARGYSGYPPGAPPFNGAHYSVFRTLAEEIDPAASKELDAAMDRLYQTVAKYNSSPAEVAASAERAAQTAATFVERVNDSNYDAAKTARALIKLSQQGMTLANGDTRTAEQTAMALDSLYISYAQSSGQSPVVRSAIDGLFKLLQNPSAYNAPQFRLQMERVNVALGAAGIR